MFARLLLVLILASGGAQVVLSGAEQLTASGNEKLASGDVVGAVADFRAAVATDGHAFEARVNLGAALLRLDDLEGATKSLEAAVAVRGSSAPALRNLGRAYLKSERWVDAARVLRKAAKLEPNHADVDRLLGIALLRSGRIDEALKRLERGARGGRPDDLELFVELGAAQLDAGKRKAASSTADRALKMARATSLTEGNAASISGARNRLGLVLQRLGRASEAVAEFRAAAALDRSNTDALANAGAVLIDAGQGKDAVKLLKQAASRSGDPAIYYLLGEARLAAGDAKRAILDLERALSWGHDPVRVSAALAEAYEKTGQTKQASAFRKGSRGSKGLEVAGKKAQEGTALLAKRQYAEAEPRLAAASKKFPKDGALHYNLGLARVGLKDFRGALPPLRRASRLIPKETAVHYQLGVAYEELGERKDAIDAFVAVLGVAPKRADVSARVGHLLLELGRNEDSLRHLKRAAKGLPASFDVQHDLAVAYTRLERSTQALAPLRRVVKAKPKDLEAREAYAHALLAAGQIPKAAQQYRELAKARPGIARHHINLAVTMRRAGDKKAEKRALRAAAKLAPDDAQVAGDLGRLYFEDKAWTKAFNAFTRAAALDPSNTQYAANALTAKNNVAVERQNAANADFRRTHLHIGVIITTTKPEAAAAKKKVLRSGKFSEIAKVTSTHESSVRGGDLGWQDPKGLPEWASIARELEPGGVSTVVEVPGGFAVFYRFTD